jgi:hypothetical protein
MEYVVTLAVTITQISPLEGTQKTVLRKVSTCELVGVSAAKAAYDAFVSEIKGAAYTEDDTTQTTVSHAP